MNAYALSSSNDFELDSIKGKVSLSDFKDKVVILYFGYTSCPDICPTSLSRISLAYKSLNKQQQDQIQPLLISLDPERDTKEKLEQYAKYFIPNMIGLTGTTEQIAKIAAHYKVSYRKTEVESGLGYVIDHASIYFVIGKDGKLYSHLLHDVTPDEIAELLQEAVGTVATNTVKENTNLQYKNIWIRATPPGQKITAAYLHIKNTGNIDLKLIGASSDIAKKIELHQHTMVDGMMNMRQVESIAIPAGKTATLEPSGYHMMIFNLKQAIKQDEMIKINLQFSDGSVKSMDFKAQMGM